MRTLFLVFCFLPALLSAQQWAPGGAEWCLRGYDGNDETVGYVRVRYERDTVVNDRPMKVLSVQAKDVTGRGLETGAFRGRELLWQSGDSVFYFIPDIGVSVFLFKESYEAGETTTTWMYNDYFDVSETWEADFGGVTLPAAKMNLPAWLGRDLPVTMYGHLGPDRGFIENWSYYLAGQGGLDLEAYRATGVTQIKIRERSQCFALMDANTDPVTTTVPLEDCRVIPFPNPMVGDRLTIRFDCRAFQEGEWFVTVFDEHGRAVLPERRTGVMPYSVRVGHLLGGKYFGAVTDGETTYRFTFVKN